MALKELIHFLGAHPDAEHHAGSAESEYHFPHINLKVMVNPYGDIPARMVTMYDANGNVYNRARAKNWYRFGERWWFKYVTEEIARRTRIHNDLFGDK
jgi:hypothetical protein